MTTLSAIPSLSNELRCLYADGSARLQTEFAASRDGVAAARGRASLVDCLCRRLWNEFISKELGGPEKFALVALGGYGRGTLLPQSDVDLLFLHDGSWSEGAYRDKNSPVFAGNLGPAAAPEPVHPHAAGMRKV